MNVGVWFTELFVVFVGLNVSHALSTLFVIVLPISVALDTIRAIFDTDRDGSIWTQWVKWWLDGERVVRLWLWRGRSQAPLRLRPSYNLDTSHHNTSDTDKHSVKDYFVNTFLLLFTIKSFELCCWLWDVKEMLRVKKTF